ncbi:general L-amino acid ABC transporter membrane protein [Phreatobacter oligotrophus]|uniref:General L-amino acid ABC transporter membrane protein n=2 Tax=Phreatobacter oligotrophus TaxID=1122261 RepID=A0A2T4YZC6_9HYPH|nr:general L-amino acid ABC transporter membrane protein [Phreatobacter oligotrophus]
MTSVTDTAPAAPSAVARAMKDALFAALVAAGVFGPLLAFKTTQDMQNRLIVEPRWDLLAIVVLIVWAGRFLLSFWSYTRSSEPRPARVAITLPAVVSRGLPPAALVALFVYPMMILSLTGGGGALKWIDNFGIQILIYVMLAWGLNIVVGLAGLLDLGYVAFYAVGAYAYALIATKVIPATFPGLGVWAFWICLPIAGILAAFWGVLLGFPVLRLRGDYLAIVTLAFGEIIRLVLINWTDFSNGYEGISTIPRPTFFGVPFNASDSGFAARFGFEFSPVHRTIFLYYVIVCLALLTAWVSNRLRRLPVGRAWEALREDEIACRSLGINTVNTKLTAFAIGAMFGGFAGSFFAARQGFISPESFTFMESAVILAIVVLGGMGSLIGTAIAAVAMIGGTELLRELEWTKAIFGPQFDPAQYRMLIFGFAMVVIMVWKPRGFVSTRMPTAFLKRRQAVSGSLVKEGHG